MQTIMTSLLRDDREYPELTESGPRTAEYVTATRDGYLDSTTSHSPTPTLAAVNTEKAGTDGIQHVDGIKVVTWLIDDPENPRNWSKARRWLYTIVVSLMCVTVGIGSSVIVLSFEELAADLNVSLDVTHLTVCLFVVGFGIGPLAWAPLSELYGRQPIYILSMFLYFVFTFPSAFAKNGASMVVGRALAGISAAAPMTNAGGKSTDLSDSYADLAGTISDLWGPNERGLPLAVFSNVLFMGPSLGPIIGGFLPSWHWVYYFLLILTGVTWLMAMLVLRETFPPAILRKRAIKLRKETGDQSFMTEQERHKRSVGEIVKIAVGKPLVMLATEGIIICFSLYLSLVYSVLYVFFFAFPYVFATNHGFTVWQTGLSFVSVIIGMVLFFVIAGPIQHRYYAKQIVLAREKGNGVVPPEARLPAMAVGAFVLPASLFIFAFCSYPHVHWIGSAIGATLFGFSCVLVYNGANSYIVDAYAGGSTASAMAAKTLLSRLCGAAVPMFVDRFYSSAIGIEWASGVLAFIALLMIPIPFAFMKYGPAIRARSKLAIH